MNCKALFFFLLLPISVVAQNLVPNGSFEEFEECPELMTQIEKATGWMSFRITPDYFNACSEPGGVGVPENVMTTNQVALHGDAYAGFGQLAMPSGNSELLGIELLSPLEVGQTYYLSFSIVRGTPSTSNCWANKMGAQLSMRSYSDWPWEVTMPISNEPQVYTENLVADTVNWTKIEGYFTADSAYRYLAIGNHFTPDSIQVECADELYNYQAYYFVDCVCLALDAEMCSDCDRFSIANSANRASEAICYPNPFSEQLIIESSDNEVDLEQLRLISSDGRLILKSSAIRSDRLVINDLGYLQSGFYILEVEFKNGANQRIKLIKN